MTASETKNTPTSQIGTDIKNGSLDKVLNRLKQRFEQVARARREHAQVLVDAKQLVINRANSGQCPKCGSNNLQAVHSATQKGFSDTGACSGCCCLGPVGLLCGFCGSGKKQEQSYRMCLNCGNKF